MLTLVVALLPRLHAWARRSLNGHPDADDVVQLTCIRATSTPSACRDHALLTKWVWAIARNALKDAIRKRLRGRWGTEKELNALSHARELTPIDRHEQEDECQAILAVIRTLPQAQRSALLVRLGLQAPKPAQSATNRDVALSRARTALRKRLADLGLGLR